MLKKQDATKWPNQPVLQAVHSCFAMFNIRIAENRLFWGFHYNPLIDLYPLFWTHTPPLEISKSSWLCHPSDPSITVVYPETRKTRTKISQDWVIRFAKKKKKKLGIIDVLTRVSTGVNLEPDGQAHREERVKYYLALVFTSKHEFRDFSRLSDPIREKT